MASGPSIVAKFLADTSQLTGQVDKATGKAQTSLGSFAKKAATTLGVAFAGKEVLDFAKDSVGAASDLNESMSKVGVVFGRSSDKVLAWSKDSAESMGISQQAALEAAGTYGNLAVALGLPTSKATDMSTNLVELAGDLASFNNVPVGDALEALRSGLTGETEPLKKFGININDTTLKAEAMRLGLVKATVDQDKLSTSQETFDKASRKVLEAYKKHGKGSQEYKDAVRDAEQANRKLAVVMEGKVPKSLTAAQKAQASYSLMMKQTATAQGDFARTSDGLANQQRIASAEMENFKAVLGAQLLPVIVTVAGFLTNTLLPAFEASFGWLMDNKTVIIAALIGIGAVLLPTFITWATSAALAAAATIAAAAPMILIAAAVAGVAYVIIHNWSTIVRVTKATWNAVLGVVQGVWNWIKRNWPLLLAVITGPIGVAAVLVVRNWNRIKGAVLAVFNWIRSNWPKILAVITGPIGTAVYLVIRNWNTIKTAVNSVISWVNVNWRRLVTIITAPISSAAHTVGVLFSSIKNAASDLYNWVAGKFRAIASAISGAVGSISGAIGRVASAIKSPINAVISAWNRLQFTVPSVQLPSFAGLTVLGKTVIPGWTGPRIGGYSIGFPDLPHLAAGAVLSSPTLFVGGEAGRELVAPESLLRQIVSEEGGGATFVLNMYPRHADANDVAYGFRRLELLAGVR